MAGTITNRTTRSRLQQALSGFNSDKREDLIKALGTTVGWEDGSLLTGTGTPSTLVLVASKEDFPEPTSSGAIQLLDNYTYFVTKSIDLEGSYLVGGRNTTIIGGSSENCILSSTGLGPSTALLQSQWSLPVRNVAFTAERAIDLDASNNANQALDWFGVNFLDCSTIGVVKSYSNVIFQTCGILNSQGLTVDGTIGTIGFSQTIFDCRPGGTCLILPSTLTVTRRFRVIYSAVVVLSGETGINASVSSTIPTEGYILDTVNFSGAGTYLSGIQSTSNTALFSNCTGIQNTSAGAQLYMQGNTTPTAISSTATFFKIAGTTVAGTSNSKFSHSNNRLTCTAVVPRKYLITATLSFSAGLNNVCEFGFYNSNISSVELPSTIKSTANIGGVIGRSENVSIQFVTFLDNNDFIEVWVRNTTATTNVVVEELNLAITEV